VDDQRQRELARLRREVEQLREGLETRAVIGQAVGLLMERHHVSSERAWDLLVRDSRNENRKIRELASALVAEADEAGRGRGDAAPATS
jgi:AmiR/NasT family two-component response regulator